MSDDIFALLFSKDMKKFQTAGIAAEVEFFVQKGKSVEKHFQFAHPRLRRGRHQIEVTIRVLIIPKKVVLLHDT